VSHLGENSKGKEAFGARRRNMGPPQIGPSTGIVTESSGVDFRIIFKRLLG